MSKLRNRLIAFTDVSLSEVIAEWLDLEDWEENSGSKNIDIDSDSKNIDIDSDTDGEEDVEDKMQFNRLT